MSPTRICAGSSRFPIPMQLISGTPRSRHTREMCIRDRYNACMGKIVAAPTAGSCGILPGALLAAQEADGFSDDELVMALFAAAAIGRAIALQATISGAEGGCQAECGTAAGMAAAALTQLYGGSPEAAAHACAFALMNTLGLVLSLIHI